MTATEEATRVEELMPYARAMASAFLRDHPRYDPDDAESDATVGVLEAVRKHRPDGGASVKMLAGQMAVWRMLDGYRNRFQRRAGPKNRCQGEACSDKCLEDVMSPASSHEHVVDTAEELEYLLRCELTAKESLILRLRYIRGVRVEDIGKLFGHSASHVWGILRDAMRRLKQRHEESDHDRSTN